MLPPTASRHQVWLLVLVFADDSRLRNQRMQRQTWLCRDWQTPQSWKYVYVKGRAANAVQAGVTREGDTLRLNGIHEKKGYGKPFSKTIVAFRWAVNHVDFQVVFKTDDDTVVHIGNLVGWLQHCSPSDLPTLYAGQHIWTSQQVARKGSDRITRDPQHTVPEFVNRYFNLSAQYPPYASGPGYALGLQAIRSLLAHLGQILASQTQPLWVLGASGDAMLALLLQKPPQRFRTDIKLRVGGRTAEAVSRGYLGHVFAVTGTDSLMTSDPEARFCAMLRFPEDLEQQEVLLRCFTDWRAGRRAQANMSCTG